MKNKDKKLDPLLLNMAASWSQKAYNKKNSGTIKIESKFSSTTVYIKKNNSIDVIAFRGTQQGRDWLTDAFIVPIPYAGRLCHGGFTLAHRSVWKKILPHINMKKRTLICGHSLGGALAELSAAKLWKKHPNLNLVTFGKPNTFFKGFKRAMKLDNQLSCVHGSDLVATVPRLCYGASKSQTMLYFANCGVDFINPDNLTRKEDRGSLGDRLTDHFMEGYTKRLGDYLKHQNKKPSKAEIKELEAIADELENT